MAFIEVSLEELPVRADLGPSYLATKISAPGPSLLGGSAIVDGVHRTPAAGGAPRQRAEEGR